MDYATVLQILDSALRLETALLASNRQPVMIQSIKQAATLMFASRLGLVWIGCPIVGEKSRADME